MLLKLWGAEKIQLDTRKLKPKALKVVFVNTLLKMDDIQQPLFSALSKGKLDLIGVLDD